MFTSPKTILKLFSATALLRAKSILQNSNDINELLDSAAKEISSGKKQISNIKDEVRLIISMLKSWVRGDYKEVPWTTLVLCAGALIYFVNPLDAVPDLIPGVGLLDDATVIGFVLASVKQDINNFKTQNSQFTPETAHLLVAN
jgi:uncharacterized membrane protein YkvA (DUF1232 family)